MSRLGLAFRCFFSLLFNGRLPAAAAPAAAQLLPAPAASASGTVMSPTPQVQNKTEAQANAALEAKVAQAESKTKTTAAGNQRDGALALLALLQREGRLVDFLREDIASFADADIGAAARDVHRGCRKVIDQYLTLEAVMPGEEEAKVSVPKGFDPSEIRLIGEARGDGPFTGTMRHHGWRVTQAKLPALADGVDRHVVAPAEVEVAS
jgi:Domain of unknown function (DUF2760)